MSTELEVLLSAAYRVRDKIRQHTNALRLVNGIGDRLPGLILEQYDRHAVAQIFSGRWLKEKAALIEFVATQLGCEYFVVKDRTESSLARPDAFVTQVWISGPSSQTVVIENDLKFKVDCHDALNTGLFLDMRHNRQLVAQLARGAKVWNGFAYTCSFGVTCRAAGAKQVVNVDISAKNLARGRVNYELNHLNYERNEFIRADAMQYLERARGKNNLFDLIIIDPPSFARQGGKNFSVKRDLPKLLVNAIEVLNRGGSLLVATNYNGLSVDDLEKMVKAASVRWVIKRWRRLSQDADFVGSGKMPESYLAALLVQY